MAAPIVPSGSPGDQISILLVDDQPAKLLSYEVMLSGLGEKLIKVGSPQEALTTLLKTDDVAVVLIDVVMPELDGFQLAAMIREHPRFQKLAMIFVSAVQIAESDHLRGYESGAVDYVAVPVVPEVLRAKVKVFVELYRKSRQLEALNAELERRVAARTAELEAQTERLRQSEERRSLALSAADMGSWELDVESGRFLWDEGQFHIFGVDSSPLRADARTRGRHDPSRRSRDLRAGRRARRRQRPLQAGVPRHQALGRGALVLRRRRRHPRRGRRAAPVERRHGRHHREEARR